MGRQRIQALMAQIEANAEAQLKLDAKIYAVAQVATNILKEIAQSEQQQLPD